MVLRSTVCAAAEEHPAPAVDQDEVALRAEAAQVERGDAAARIVRESGGAGNDLRQRVDHLLDVDRAGQAELLVLDDRQRAGRGEVAPRDARTGDDDRFAGGGILGVVGDVRLGLYRG